MPWLSSHIIDNGLVKLHEEGTRLDICSTEPDTYAKATDTLSLGRKTQIVIGEPQERPQAGKQPGRKVIVGAFTDGEVTKTGSAAFWAITDPGNSRLLATGKLPAATATSKDFVFTLGAFDIGIPNCA